MLRLPLALGATAAVLAAGFVAPAPASAEATVGACYSYKVGTLGDLSSAAPAVACTAKHTAETYYVRTLPEAFGTPSKASLAKRLSAAEPCSVKAMNSYLGMPDRKLPSRFLSVALFPTDDEWAAGQRWMRCDAVLQGGTSLVTLTQPAAALVASAPAEQFDFCTPGTPNAKKTAAFPCNKPKSNWIKVLDRDLGKPGSAFPGSRSVENRTRSLCRAQGKTWNGKEKYPGWWAIWPTAVGWRKGQRSAQCFVPYKQYQAELAQRAPQPTPTPAADPALTADPAMGDANDLSFTGNDLAEPA